jgi:hypothetical protein
VKEQEQSEEFKIDSPQEDKTEEVKADRNPQDTQIVSRDLHGDPNDQEVIRAMENMKGWRDKRMYGTY